MYIRRQKTFTTEDGTRVLYNTQIVDEPESGVNYAPEMALFDIPSGTDGEEYVGGFASGPEGSEDATIEISLDDGGSWLDLADGPVAVGGTPGAAHGILARAAIAPIDGLTNARIVFVFGAEEGGAAGYAD